MAADRDIKDRADIKVLIDTFYKRAIHDPAIGVFFTEVVELDLQTHMPIMYRFWDSVLFQNTEYRGDPMAKHVNLHHQMAMTKAHFDRWLSLFKTTVDELYKGPTAELAKTRATSIATVMQIKIAQQA